MIRFRHAVQLCTIAFVSIAIHGHVLLAVNIKDFKNLADQFLSKTLAKKLNRLVSESVKTTKRDDTKAGDQYTNLDLKKVADIIRAKLLNEDKEPPKTSTEKVTRNQKIKRFSTVKNTLATEILRNFNSKKTSSGLEYVRDDLDQLLQSKPEEEANDNHKQLDYAEIRLNESEERIVSQEPSDSKGSFDMMREKHNEINSETNKKVDYTETKLGDWLYNHIISQKPVKLQNHKIANIEVNTEELSDKSENVRNVQYVYQTHSKRPNNSSRQNVQNLEPLRPKNKDTDNVNIVDQVTDERGTSKEYVMGPKMNTIYKKKPQKLIEKNYPGSFTKDQEIENRQLMNKNDYVTPFQGNENTFIQENKGLDKGGGNLKESINNKMESSLYDAVEGKNQPIEEHIPYDKYILGSKDTENHIKELQGQPVRDKYENYKLEQTKSSNNNSVDLQQPDDSGEKLMLEMKKTFDGERIASNIDKANRSTNRDQLLLRNKKRDRDISENYNYISDYKKVKSNSVKSKIESSLEDTVGVKDQPKEDYITPIKDENYIQRKKTQKQPVEENDMYKKYELGSETKSNKEVRPLDDDYVFKQSTPESKHEFDEDVSNIDDELSNRDIPILRSTKRDNSVEVAKNEVITTLVPIKKGNFDEDSLPDFQAVRLGSSSSDEINNKQAVDHHTFNKHNLKKDTLKKKPKKQPIEENDMYEKYLLGSKDNDNEDKEVKKGGDTFDHKETLGKNNKDEENETYDKYSLVSKNKNSKGRNVKKENDNYGYKKIISGKNNKEDYHVRDTNEENDMYDKYSSGSDDNDINNREVKNDNDNNRHKETNLGNNHKRDHRIRHKDAENDRYDKYSLGSKDKNSKDREVKKSDGKYGHKETFSGKKNYGDHRIRDKDEENDVYDKYSLGSKDRNSKDGDVKYDYKETFPGEKIKGHQPFRDKDRENEMYDKYSLGSKYKNNKGKRVIKDDKYGHKETVFKKYKGEHRVPDKDENNDIYHKHSIGSKDNNRNSRDRKVKTQKDAFKRQKNKEDRLGRDKDAFKLVLKKNRHNVKEAKKDIPPEGYADDPRPDFKEVKSESIKAKTESLLDSVEDNRKPIKRFTMKGTLIPKREFYKLSSPNYYTNLPRVVDKYDFAEPLPERDRQRDKVGYLRREPARVNGKLKLPIFEKVI